MANTFQSTSVASGLAEIFPNFRGPMIESINNDIPIYRAAQKVKEGWSGSKVTRPLRVNRNQGVGATSDGGNLPKIGKQGVVQAEIAAKYNYLRFGITGPMIKHSQSDAGSFVRSAAYELKSGYEDLKNDINRQLCWDGTNDIALVSSASNASSTLVVKGRSTSEPALKYIDIGTTFDVLNGTTLVASGVTVSSISSGTATSSTATLVLDQPLTTAADYILIRSGTQDQEIQGLFYALDGGTGTVYNVDRSTALAYQGNVSNISSEANPVLTIDAMQNPFNEGLRRGSIGAYNAVYTDFTSLRYYQKLLTADKRYTNTVEGDGTFGKKGQFYLDFNGIAIVPDKDMPTRFVFLPAEVLKLYELCAMELVNEQGSMYIAQSDTDAFEVRIRHFVNLFNEQPAACGVLLGYSAP